MSDHEQLSLFDFKNTEPAAPLINLNRDLIPTDAKIAIPLGTYHTLEEIANHCNHCYRCELGQNRTHAVIGRGNIQAPIMIIGEAPGQNEDEQGLPFVGRSGQLLEKF